jgi:hypothetical protein
MPISNTAPTMTSVVNLRSRNTISTGVPTNADMPSLSNTGSAPSGASSSTN